MCANASAEAPPHYFTMDDLEFLRANVGFMKIDTLMQAIRNQDDGDTRSTLDYADLDQLLPALNIAMWMAKGRPQQQRVATSATPSRASSHATSDQPTAVLADKPDLALPNLPPPTALQQIGQPPCTDHKALFSSTAAVMAAQSTASDSLTSSVISRNQTGGTGQSTPSHLQEDEVENASSHDVSAFHIQVPAFSAATSSTTAPRKKTKGKGLARAKSRPMLVINPHHADIGIFAGKTVEEILTPNNGISPDEFFGARALFISAHFKGHKEALEKINQKRKAEGLAEMRFKDKTWNHRLENALMHKFGPAVYDVSLKELGKAREDDQARAAYVAMLMNDLTNERNPTSVCTDKSCIGKRAREQKGSLNTSAASTPAIGSCGTPYAIGSATGGACGESSNEAPASEIYNVNTGATAPRSLKRGRNSNNTEPAFEDPDEPSIKRRKARKDRSGYEQALAFNNPALDPTLFPRTHAQGNGAYPPHYPYGNGGVIQNHAQHVAAAEAYSHSISSSIAPGSHAAFTYFDDQTSDWTFPGNVNGAVAAQEVDDAQKLGEFHSDFEAATAYVGSGIDSDHAGPA